MNRKDWERELYKQFYLKSELKDLGEYVIARQSPEKILSYIRELLQEQLTEVEKVVEGMKTKGAMYNRSQEFYRPINARLTDILSKVQAMKDELSS